MSPEETVYSNGGRGVQVGSGVDVAVEVGVVVMVGVSEGVGVMVGSTTCPVELSTAKTTAAPIPRIKMIRPIAIGRLSVTSGMRGPWMFERVLLLAGSGKSTLENVLPHTRHRVALSLMRVPQFGHTFVFGLFISGLIRSL